MLLHAALLFLKHPRPEKQSGAWQHAMQVFISHPVVSEQPRILPEVPNKKIEHPAQTQAVPFAIQSTAKPASASPSKMNMQRLMESAKGIARDDAVKTEQQIAAMEKKKLNTPAASMQQSLKQRHAGMRLANGKLKIITSAGAVCFQPAPDFARDSAELFGIPSSCP